MLDLTFSNIQDIATTVRTDLHWGSDHETLVTTIQGGDYKPQAQYRYRLTEADLPQFTGLVERGVAELPSPWHITSFSELNDITATLEKVFKIAIESAGRRDRGGGKPASWWTQECRDAYKAYRKVRKLDTGLTPERRTFLTIVRKAKREYWQHKINNAKDDASLYKIINWHKPSTDLKAPSSLMENG